MSEVLTSVKTNFTSGELAADLYGRGDLNTYENGARNLKNVIIHPTGGVSRRGGLKKTDELLGKARLIPFEFNTEQVYLICLTDLKCTVYKNDEAIAVLNTPWNETQIFELKYTQSADKLFIVHKDFAPRVLTRGANESWSVGVFDFYKDENGLYCCPYYNYNHGTKVKALATNGNTSVEADHSVFESSHVGSHLKFSDGCAKITGYVSATKVNVQVLKNFSNTNYTDLWEESAVSAARGWPANITFHQDRLVFGGSKSLPNHVWMSQSSDFYNFDTGTGLDNEAIDFALLSDQVNAIRDVVSSRNLIVFTGGAEWVIKGESLTPETTSIVKQTNVGTYGHIAVSSVSANGALVFVSANGKQVQQFLYNELEDSYQATNLSLLAGEIVKNPCDMAFSGYENVVYVVLEDGSVSCLTTYRAEQVTAWSRLQTNGKFQSVASLEDNLYFSVYRNGKYFLEKLSQEAYFDCFQNKTADLPQTTWNGLSDFEDEEIGVIADGYYIGKYTVQDGSITLPEAVSEIVVGLPYEHLIEPLPFVSPYQNALSPKSLRVVSAVYRIINSRGFCIDLGKGYQEVPLKNISNQYHFDEETAEYSGDVELYALGWTRDINKPVWSIKSDVPVSFTLLSTTMKVKTK